MSYSAIRHSTGRRPDPTTSRGAASVGGAFGLDDRPPVVGPAVRVLVGAEAIDPTVWGGPYRPEFAWESRSQTCTREGIEALVDAGADAVNQMLRTLWATDEGGPELPWNLARWACGGLDRTAYGRLAFHHRRDTAGVDRVERAARLGGWLRAVADGGAREFPGIVKLIRATQSYRGVNSPRTTLDLVALIERWPSPHQLERHIWRVMERTIAILSAWPGRPRPSWRAIGAGVAAERRTGKAAIVAAAVHLTCDLTIGRYRRAREALVDLHATPRHVVAGHECRTAVLPAWTMLGMRVHRAWRRTEHGRWAAAWVVRLGNRVALCAARGILLVPQCAARHAVRQWREDRDTSNREIAA